jgi:hypothetical protein
MKMRNVEQRIRHLEQQAGDGDGGHGGDGDDRCITITSSDDFFGPEQRRRLEELGLAGPDEVERVRVGRRDGA